MFFKRPQARQETLTMDELTIEVSYKPIRNIYLRISRRTGEIRISAPVEATHIGVRQFLRDRENWIRKQLKDRVSYTQPVKLQYKDGEVHRFNGKEYTLKVTKASAPPKVQVLNGELRLRIRPGSNREQRMKVLDEWYRSHLKAQIPALIERWEPVMGVKVKEFGVKKMKTRWGTCNTRAQRIWLGLELAKYSSEALEYVVVHEMVHLLERLHSKRFYALMSRFLPDWRKREQELKGLSC